MRKDSNKFNSFNQKISNMNKGERKEQSAQINQKKKTQKITVIIKNIFQ